MALFALVFAISMYIFMIIMNVLANALPLNGINTGDVSFKYPNLFQPSGYTFSIWGIIYALLLAYLVFQVAHFTHIQQQNNTVIYMRINFLFGLTSLLNGLWLVFWHYDNMILSTIFMIVLLVLLILIAKSTTETTILTKTSFSTYLGWIMVATIANITILLVKLGVPNLNMMAVILTVAVLIIGVIISFFWMTKEKDFIFGMVIIWAYLGILIRHITKENLNQSFPLIYYTTIICLIFMMVTTLSTFLKA